MYTFTDKIILQLVADNISLQFFYKNIAMSSGKIHYEGASAVPCRSFISKLLIKSDKTLLPWSLFDTSPTLAAAVEGADVKINSDFRKRLTYTSVLVLSKSRPTFKQGVKILETISILAYGRQRRY